MHPEIAALNLGAWPELNEPQRPQKASPVQQMAEAVKYQRSKLFSTKRLVVEDCGCGDGSECPSRIAYYEYD